MALYAIIFCLDFCIHIEINKQLEGQPKNSSFYHINMKRHSIVVRIDYLDVFIFNQNIFCVARNSYN